MRLLPLLLGLALLLPALARAQGPGGAPQDQLGWPGSPTDRYLEGGELRTVLHGATEGFFECFRAGMRTRSEGGASVRFVVDRTGKARDIEVELGKAPATVAPCVVQVVQALDFGDHDGDPLPASYPLVYQVDKRGARILPYPIVFTKPVPVRLPLIDLPPDLRPGELRMLELVLTDDGEPPQESPEAEQADPKATEAEQAEREGPAEPEATEAEEASTPEVAEP